MDNVIAVLLTLVVIVLYLVYDSYTDMRHLRFMKSFLKEGNRIVYYECINKEFDDWREISSCVIVECRDNSFKYQYDNGAIGYCEYQRFGAYDDKVEVYEGNKIVYQHCFEPFCDF